MPIGPSIQTSDGSCERSVPHHHGSDMPRMQRSTLRQRGQGPGQRSERIRQAGHYHLNTGHATLHCSRAPGHRHTQTPWHERLLVWSTTTPKDPRSPHLDSNAERSRGDSCDTRRRSEWSRAQSSIRTRLLHSCWGSGCRPWRCCPSVNSAALLREYGGSEDLIN